MFNDTYSYVSTLLEESKDKTTSVYVVKHKQLGTKRVLKAVKKSKNDSHNFLTEAQILASLQHTGIPALYDYGEDENYICLIEELVTGMSLREYLLSHEFRLDEIIGIISKTSDILIYLHEREIPILYQDLKPEHLIINGEDIRLIDYGIARTINDSGNSKMNFGTYLYASPEAKKGLPVDERTDIYSLGMLLNTLLQHTEEKIPYALDCLIEKATAEDKGERLSSVREFKELLLQAKSESKFAPPFSNKKTEKDCLQKTIAVIGTEHAIGTTHIALSFVSFLNKRGLSALYVNESGNDVTRHLLENESRFKIKSTCIYHNDFKGLRELGDLVNQDVSFSGIRVLDCGTDYGKASLSYAVIYVFSSCPWRSTTIDKKAPIGKNTVFIVNPESKTLGIKLSKFFKRKVFGFPKNDDAFVMTGKKELLFERIFKEVM